MTIAAGFFYQGGLLLCADTQATGAYKIHGSKLLPNLYDDGSRTVFVTVGHLSYARMGAQVSEVAIGRIGKESRTTQAIHDAIAGEVYSLYVKHLYQHPSWGIDGDLRVKYLVGVWSAKDQEVSFFKNEDSALERLYGYECIGSGAELAHFLIRPFYTRRARKNAPHEHSKGYVLDLAVQAFEKVKTHDPNCGGDTQWMTLSDDGQHDAGVEPITPLPSPTSLEDRATLKRPTRGRKSRLRSRE